MKKRISLILAIVMILATVMTAMPIISLPATATATENAGCSVYEASYSSSTGTYSSTGTLYVGAFNKTVDGGTFAEAVEHARSATRDVIIVLNDDIKVTSSTSLLNTSSVIAIDGNSHKLSFIGGNGFYFGSDGSNEVEGAKLVQFQNIDIYVESTGTPFKMYADSSLTLKNASMTGFARWAAINLEGTKTGRMNLTVDGCYIAVKIVSGVGGSDASLIATGNPGIANLSNITLKNSELFGNAAIGVTKNSASDIVVDGCYIFGAYGGAIAIRNTPYPDATNPTAKTKYTVTNTAFDAAVTKPIKTFEETVSSTDSTIIDPNRAIDTANSSISTVTKDIASVTVSGGSTTNYSKWADVVSAVSAATADVEVKLLANVGINDLRLDNQQGTASSVAAKITFNGNGKKVFSSGSNALKLGTDQGGAGATPREPVDITVKDFTYLYGGVGSAIQSYGFGKVEINNVDIDVFPSAYSKIAEEDASAVLRTINFSVINALNDSGTAVDMDLIDVNVNLSNVGNSAGASAVRTGNGGNTVDLALTGCNINVTAPNGDLNKKNPVAALAVTTKLATVKIDSSVLSSRYGYAIASPSEVGAEISLKNTAINATATRFPISGVATIILNEGEWTNNTFNGAPNGLSAAGRASALDDVCPAEVYVGGANVATHTKWSELVADVNTRLATDDVTVKLTGDVKIAGNSGNGNMIGSASGKKLTVESADANNRVNFYTHFIHHAIFPLGNIEFKNINFFQNTSNALFHHNNSNQAKDSAATPKVMAGGFTFALTNCDINIGDLVPYYVIGYADMTIGSASAPAALTLDNVKVRDSGTKNQVAVICPGNAGDTAYLNITISNSDIDFTGGNGTALKLLVTGDPAVDNKNVMLITYNTKIAAWGDFDAISGAEYLDWVSIDQTNCVFTKNGEFCNTDILTPPATTAAPETTEAPTTEAPATSAPTTDAPVSSEPTTDAPTTSAPTTDAPTTSAPTTDAPATSAPTTDAPTTSVPTTDAPTTSAPTTDAPTTTGTPTVTFPPVVTFPPIDTPTTQAPTTKTPITLPPIATAGPTTEAPTTNTPSTLPPIGTDKPATQAPVTNAPTENVPTTQAPSTDAPATDNVTTAGDTVPAHRDCAGCGGISIAAQIIALICAAAVIIIKKK